MAKRQARMRKGKGKGKGKGKAEEPALGLGRMDDLDTNMLLQIFAKLSVIDLVVRISGVCKFWRSVCSEPSDLWKTLELEKFKGYFNSKYSDRANEQGLMSFKVALRLGGRHVEKLIFDHSPDVTDELLIFAAQRCQGLKELMLPFSHFCTNRGLIRAIEFWRSLESLTIEFYYCGGCPYNILQVIGANCKNLTTLRLRSCVFHHEVATILAESVPGLKVLTIRCADIEKQAAEVLLDKLKNLEELYLSLSSPVFITPFVEPRFLPPLDDEAMIRKVGKLQQFHFCIGYCMPCIAITMGESALKALNLPPPI